MKKNRRKKIGNPNKKESSEKPCLGFHIENITPRRMSSNGTAATSNIADITPKDASTMTHESKSLDEEWKAKVDQKLDLILGTIISAQMGETKKTVEVKGLEVKGLEVKGLEVNGLVDEVDVDFFMNKITKTEKDEAMDKTGGDRSLYEVVVEFPFTCIAAIENLNKKLKDSTFYWDMAKYLSTIGGKDDAKLTTKIFNKIISKELQGQLFWDNKGSTIQSFPYLLSVVHAAGRMKSSTYTEQAGNEKIKNLLRNARLKKK